MGLAVRNATEADLVFVIDSWQKSYRLSHRAGLISMDDWPGIMTVQLRKVLNREGVRVLVAYQSKATTTIADIAGWIAFEHGYDRPSRKRINGRWTKVIEKPEAPLVHFFYTKHHYRRMGIWTRLLSESGIDPGKPMYLTCETGALSDLPITSVTFDPLIARFPRKPNGEQETSTKETSTSTRAKAKARRSRSGRGRRA